ncbi:MAG: hypothetical protein IOD12_02150 [Silvanigrellales bacterium]|nr:hypothetical protein [Silvanigrellales bacterium]
MKKSIQNTLKKIMVTGTELEKGNAVWALVIFGTAYYLFSSHTDFWNTLAIMGIGECVQR